MKLPSSFASSSEVSEMATEPGIHSDSGLVLPWLTKWIFNRLFAAGERGRPSAFVLVSVQLAVPDHVSYGPGAKEEMLRFVGGELCDALRDADAAGHMDGKEILIMLPNEDETGAEAVSRRVARRLSGARLPSGRQMEVRAIPFVNETGASSPHELLSGARRTLRSDE